MINEVDIHHGQTLEKIIRRNGHSISNIAREINVNRRSVYNWFTQRRLKTEIILNVGKVIDYDFSGDFPELFKPVIFRRLMSDDTIGAEGQFRDSFDKDLIWKDKYLDLLERYNFLLSKQM